MSDPVTSSPAAGPARRAETALHVVNQISAMVGYWDVEQRCVFANDAYRQWFGSEATALIGRSMAELLGPLYEKNLPYIRGALAGRPQIFERRIPHPDGQARDSIATYTPEIVDGRVVGFAVHVADVSELRQREAALAQTIREAIVGLEKTKGSFRSRELGELRQHLTKVLERLEGP